MSPHCSDLSILLPVDGSENSDRAVGLLVSLYPKLAPKEVRVLHVLLPAPLADNNLSTADAVEQNLSHVGTDALQSAQTLLGGAGIPFTSAIRRGHVPQEIASYAQDLHCSAIIMGTRGMGTTEQVLGSIVRQVVALTAIPVTLVK
jgi:nucleotide-binding universal stress UspA family protein